MSDPRLSAVEADIFPARNCGIARENAILVPIVRNSVWRSNNLLECAIYIIYKRRIKDQLALRYGDFDVILTGIAVVLAPVAAPALYPEIRCS
jgi:hypothetical protein